jgi:hypothetical protein
MNRAIVLIAVVSGMLTNVAPSAIAPATAKPVTTIEREAFLKGDRSGAKGNSLQLQLVDAGAQPRRELKFTPAPNSKQTLTMEMGMNMEMSMDGQSIAAPAKLPKTLMKLDLTVTAVDPNGDIHYDFVYTDARLVPDPQTPKELITNMEKGLKTMVGIKGNIVTSNRGQITRQKLVLPPNMEPNLKQFLSQLNRSLDRISTPLPLEAVGTGAKWTTNLPLNMAGMKLNQKIDYEVLALNAEGATIKTKVTQSAPPQNMQLPGIHKVANIRLNSLTSQGEGQVVLRFNSLLPIQAKTSIDTTSDMSVKEAKNSKIMNMKNKTSIDLNMTSN